MVSMVEDKLVLMGSGSRVSTWKVNFLPEFRVHGRGKVIRTRGLSKECCPNREYLGLAEGALFLRLPG